MTVCDAAGPHDETARGESLTGLRSGALRNGRLRGKLWPGGRDLNPAPADPETTESPADLKATESTAGPEATESPAGAVTGRLRAAAGRLTPAALWRHHRLFTVAVLISVVPRIIAALGFRPALLIQDSFSYMYDGVHLRADPLRPSGYPMLLWVLQPFHSLLLVTALQYLMGIGMGVIIYTLLRSRGVPAWGATLAAAPTLLDSREVWLESSILPDTLFTFVILVAVILLLTTRTPRVWQTALAGLLVAWASVIRGNGAFVFVAVFLFLLVRRVGWRALLACVAAFAIPLLGYMAVFDHEHGQFDITDSTGLFVWARTTSFADCAVIKPPPDLQPLCPDRQPGYPGDGPAPAWSVHYLMNERSPAAYMWDPGVWYRHDAHPGYTGYNNKLAEEFAIRAIEAQPLAYLKTVGVGLMHTFLWTDRPESYLSMHFTTQPHVAKLAPYQRHDEMLYAHTTSNTHPVQPWAFFMFMYQLPVYFPGIAFFLVMLGGLAGVVRRWRGPGSFAALPWAVALINLVVPIALTEADYRYAISAVPFACLAAGMAFMRTAPHGSRQAAGTPAVPAA
jgi:hypothetical protein